MAENKRSRPVEFPRWCLRLFLSVDIVGSTIHKHSLAPASSQHLRRGKRSKDGEKVPGPDWIHTFAEFYNHFSQRLDDAWGEGLKYLKQDQTDDFGQKPEFWKSAGDELLFFSIIRSPEHAGVCLDAFRLAVIRHRHDLKKRSSRLNIKATAWLAGFPVNNMEVVIGKEPEWLQALGGSISDHYVVKTFIRTENKLVSKRYDDPNGQMEFIGPQMDLGFRLASHATPRHMILSADLVYLMLSGNSVGVNIHGELPKKCSECIRLDGKKELKGIFSGLPYPVFWIDADPNLPLNIAEDGLMPTNQLQNSNSIKLYAERFLDSCEEVWSKKPFIWTPNTDNRDEKQTPTRGRLTFGEIDHFHSKVREAYQEYLQSKTAYIKYKQDPSVGGTSRSVPEKISDRVEMVRLKLASRPKN